MSGRALRRLPVLAHARYIGLGFTSASSMSSPKKSTQRSPVNGSKTKAAAGGAPGGSGAHGLGTQVEVWLDAMEKVIQTRAGELEKFER